MAYASSALESADIYRESSTKKEEMVTDEPQELSEEDRGGESTLALPSSLAQVEITPTSPVMDGCTDVAVDLPLTSTEEDGGVADHHSAS